MDLIVYLAIGYGIGVAHEKFIKNKPLNDCWAWPYRMYLRIVRFIGKQKDKADDGEPKV
jgi:hypothetical protein